MNPDEALVTHESLPELFLRQQSPHTERAYRRDLNEFAYFIELPLAELHTLNDGVLLERATAWVHSLSGSTATVARKLSSLRSYLQFLCSVGVKIRNIARAVQAPKVKRQDPDTLTQEDLGLLLGVVDRTTWRGRRDYALLLLLAQLGLRRHEAASLTFGNLKKSAAGRTILTYTSKRGKPMRLPVADSFLRALDELHGQGRPVTDMGPLFPGERGRPLSDESVYKIIQKYARKAGLGKHITPHSLRHFMVTDALRVESNVLKVKALSGHASVGTLDRYNHLDQVETVQTIQEKRGIQ